MRKRLAPLMSSAQTGGRADWQTPAEVLELVRRVAPIGLDPCTSPANPTGAWIFAVASAEFDRLQSPGVVGPMKRDGLSPDWTWRGNTPPGSLVFVNPPYGEGIGDWTARCVVAADHGCEVIALVPARTDTSYFHRDLAPPASDAVCFWRGRVTFVNPDTGAGDPATFPSALVYYGARRFRFASVFSEAGAIWL